ncbi:NADP-dependent oxidoreductase [Plantibacter flavus]|uniref:NADP-dependent oxidoreductase n=1 Tax=Plantibacter flavus TaxID=150123 RepID=UPI003F1897E4
MATVVQYDELGSADVLQLVEVPTPHPAAGELVVEVRAAGVNPIDWKLRSGIRGGQHLAEPRRVGSDGGGVIVEVGDGVDGWAVGDEVVIVNGDGTYATHLVVTPRQIIAKPAAISFEEAAAIGIPVSTAYQALRSLGVTDGTTLLIHGGSGSVGHAAVQFARAWGAAVIATASERNHERLREIGAIPVAYGPGLVERIREAAPQGIDRVLDAVGTDEALEASFELVDDRQHIGTIVVGAKAAALGIQAWSGGNPLPLTDQEQAWRAEAIPAVAELAERGGFSFELGTIRPLAEAAEAHRESESGHPSGKLILVP